MYIWPYAKLYKTNKWTHPPLLSHCGALQIIGNFREGVSKYQHGYYKFQYQMKVFVHKNKKLTWSHL